MANEFVVRNGLISLGSVQVTGSVNVSGSLTTNGVPVPSNTDFYAYTASNNATISQLQNATASIYSTTSSFNTRIENLESFSSSLDSTYATDAQLNAATQSLSSSLNATDNIIITNFQNYTSSINSYTSSNNTNITTINSNFNSYTSSNNTNIADLELSITALNRSSASINNYTASQNVLNGTYATTGSNTFVGTQYISNTTNATSYTDTPALYTDGGFRVTKDAYVSGSVYVGGNLTVAGTSSIEYVTASAFIGLEYIDLNTDLPALRYAGIRVYDSGSNPNSTGSLLWDSQNNKWIYSNPSGSSYDGGMLISGPRNTTGLGNEVGTTDNALLKGQGGDHLTSSLIIDNGSVVSFPYDINVTGSIIATNLSGSLNGSYLISSTVSNSKLQNDSITINGTSVSLGGTLTQAQTLAGAISGSSQVDHNATTNYVANEHINHTSVSISAGSGLSGGGDITTTRTLTLDTGSTHFVNGSRGVNSAGTGVSYSGGVISIGQAVATNSNVQFNSLGVGTAGSGTTGEIRATADITAYYSSDERLKENITRIEDPIAKIKAIDGVTFSWKEGFDDIHSHTGSDTGVIAQQIESINLPDTVTTRENGYKAVKYEKLNALLIEGMKAQQAQIDFLQQQFEELKAFLNK